MKYNIICLHEFRNNGNLFMKSFDSISNKLNNINLIYITSPIKYNKTSYDNNDITFIDNIYYQWWTTSKNGLFNEEKYDTLYESIEYIYNYINTNNHIDGILGSSQGSVLTQIILYLQEYPNLFPLKYQKFKFNFKFAILGCTFSITDNELKHLYNYKLNIPILNIYGTNDTLVPYEISKEFNNKCNNIQYYEHNGKHYIPNNKSMAIRINEFINKLNLHNISNE